MQQVYAVQREYKLVIRAGSGVKKIRYCGQPSDRLTKSGLAVENQFLPNSQNSRDTEYLENWESRL
jgi:hypothetical protein